MKKMKSTVVLCILLALSTSLYGQTNEPPAKKWGAEFNILWPIFPGNLIRTQMTRSIWQNENIKGDVLFGININFPQDRETEGRFSDYSIVTGYRQYLFKGLHVEFNQQMGYGNLKNHVTTKKEYKSFDWGVQLLAGYKYDIPKTKLYTAVQLGAGSTIYQSNPWPIFTDNTLTKEVGNEIIFVGGIQLGVRF
jgi:hypothetical protein